MSARDRETIEALARVAAALDGAVLGLGTAALAVASLAKYLAASGALRRIAEAPAVAIPDIRDSLLPGLGDGQSRLAVVRGIVRSPVGGSFLIPPGSREHAVITRHTQTVSSRFLSCTVSVTLPLRKIIEHQRHHLSNYLDS